MRLNRRNLLRWSALGLTAATGGCDQTSASQPGMDALSFGNWLTYRIQRLIIPANQLAPTFPASAISADFRANGTVDPPDANYQALAKNDFTDWRLKVDGLVKKPLSLSLADLRAFPAQAQITRHNCVEGWSCIGKWGGARLSHILDEAGLMEDARFIVFFCADSMDPLSIETTNEAQTTKDDDSSSSGSHYYSSIDLVDARHPQTIIAYEMNDKPLTIPYGAPARLRVERQLGYKMPKYLMHMQVVRDFSDIRGGKGGYWEDQGYDWFAGI